MNEKLPKLEEFTVVFSTKYLKFFLVEKLPKTNVYHIYSRSSDAYLGEVRWFPTWRQYTFFPDDRTIWNKDCLRHLIEFLEMLEKERRNEGSGSREGSGG